MYEKIIQINDILNRFIWGDGMLLLIIGTGVYLTVRTFFFQFRKFGLIMKETIVSVFRNRSVTKSSDKKSISQFQALSTALAASMGTGNIAGVATALTLGGPGAIFWMWVSAIFGMMVTFGENVLGIYYRYKNKEEEWVGGPMVYIEKGLHCKWLGCIYAFLCVLASFGIGNMTQSNSIAEAMKTSFGAEPFICGIITAVIVGIILLGGMKRIGKITEMLVPFISLAYIICAVLIIVINKEAIPAAFKQIIDGAFGINAAVGGISGAVIKNAVSVGFRRGIFSNEAGLGSSALVHTASDEGEPVKQGMWAIFEVFVDTVICCTLTAFAILTSGVLGKTDTKGVLIDGSALVIEAFKSGFGQYAGIFVSVSIVLFAFATLLGWSFYGGKAAGYLFGERGKLYYRAVFIGMIICGAVTELRLVWGISDTLNGFMAVPNLIAVILLSNIIFSETKRYLKDNKKKRKEKREK